MRPTIENQLTHLEESGLIALASFMPELEYLFRHALVQDAAYDSLLKQDRRKLHRAVGETLERAYPDRLDEMASTLAYHFREANDGPRAVDYFCRAAGGALAKFANQEAEQYCRDGLKLTEDSSLRARLLASLGEALAGQSRHYEAIRMWSEAVQLYREAGDFNQAALLYAWSARSAWWAGDPPGAVELAEQGLACVPTDDDSPGVAALLHEMARSCYFTGRLDEALEPCRRALAMAERLGDAAVQAEALNTLGLLLKGREGIESLERAVAVAEQAGLLAAQARAHHNLAGLYGTAVLDFERSQYHYLRAAELAERRGMVGDQVYTLSQAAASNIVRGLMARAEALIGQMQRLMGSLEPGSTAALHGQIIVGMMRKHQGRLDEAREPFASVQRAARQARDPYMLRPVNNELAEILVEQGDWDGAREVIEEAQRLDDIDTEETALTHVAAARLMAHDGDFDAARRLLDEAERISREAGSMRGMHYAFTGRARLAGMEGQWDEAIGIYENMARQLARAQIEGIRTHLLREWAEAHLKRGASGDREWAAELLREAQAKYESMGVPVYADQVRARLAEIGG